MSEIQPCLTARFGCHVLHRPVRAVSTADSTRQYCQYSGTSRCRPGVSPTTRPAAMSVPRDLFRDQRPPQPQPDRLDERGRGRHVVDRRVQSAPGERGQEPVLQLVLAVEQDHRRGGEGHSQEPERAGRGHRQVTHRAQAFHPATLNGDVLGGHRGHRGAGAQQVGGVLLVVLVQVEASTSGSRVSAGRNQVCSESALTTTEIRYAGSGQPASGGRQRLPLEQRHLAGEPDQRLHPPRSAPPAWTGAPAPGRRPAPAP